MSKTKVIEIDFGFISNLEMHCSLIHEKGSEDLPLCSGYSRECEECEVPKYFKKARIELTKINFGVRKSAFPYYTN